MGAAPPRPHPLTRSPRVAYLNGLLEKSWAKGISQRPTLDPHELWAKALKKAPATGERAARSEAEADDFRLRLTTLCSSLAAEAQLNPLGLTIAHALLVRAIRQRLHLGNMWQDRPELSVHPIAPPIIIVGQMRSGTTRLHRLLAADPAHSSTRFCDSWNPLPRRPDTRPLWSALSLMLARQIDPWLDGIHPFGVTRADEELGWLACALDHCAYEVQWRIPEFSHFSESRDPQPVYAEFARILRTDAAWRGNAGRSRVLKVPQFSEDLPHLLAQFPGARVVSTSRKGEDVISSSASLMANQMTMQSDACDMDWIIGECRRKLALRQDRMDSALAAFSGPQAMVSFSAMDTDWHASITATYKALGLRLSDKALDAMRAEQRRAEASPQHQHARPQV